MAGGVPGIARVHDLHIRALSTTSIALMVHLVTPGGWSGDAFFDALAHQLENRFGMAHATLQIEGDDTDQCQRAPDSVV